MSSIKGTLLGRLKLLTGAALIGVASGGTLQAHLDMQGSLRSFINVQDPAYGWVEGADNYTAIMAAIAACEAAGGGVVWFPVTTYKSSETVVIENPHVHLAGAGRYASIIQKTTNALGGTDNVDAVIYYDHTNSGSGFLTGNKISGLSIFGKSNVERNAYGIYASKISFWDFEEGVIKWCDVGLEVGDGWMCSASELEIGWCGEGVRWMQGTSVNFENVWVRDCDTKGYYFYNTSYSSMTSCGADHIGNGSFSIAYEFGSGCEFTLTGCSAEDVTGVRLLANFARVTVLGWDDYVCIGWADAGRAAVEANGSSARLIMIGSSFNNYVSTTTMNAVKASNGAKLTRINTAIPTNCGTFPGTTGAYGVEMDGGEIKLSKDGVTAKAQFGASGVVNAKHGDPVTHGLGVVPKGIFLTATVTATRTVQVDQSTPATASEFKLVLRDLAGSTVDVAEDIYWFAIADDA